MVCFECATHSSKYLSVSSHVYHLFLKFIFYFYLWVYVSPLDVHIVEVSKKSKRGYQIPWNWSSKEVQSYVTRCWKLISSSLAGPTCTLNGWAITPPLFNIFLFKRGVSFLPNSYPAEKNCLIHFLFSKWLEKNCPFTCNTYSLPILHHSY